MTRTPTMGRDTLPSILLVDDDEVLRERLARAIRARGYEVKTAGSADEALRGGGGRVARDGGRWTCKMPGMSRARAAARAARASIRPPGSLMLTGYGSIATAVEAVRWARCATCPSRPTPTRSSPRSRAARHRRARAAGRRETPVAGARRVGAHPPGAHRLRRQHLRGGAPARHPPPLAAAQAAQVPALEVSRAPGRGVLRAPSPTRVGPVGVVGVDRAGEARVERVHGAQHLERQLRDRRWGCRPARPRTGRAGPSSRGPGVPGRGHHRLVVLDLAVLDDDPVRERAARRLVEAEPR